MFRTQSTAFERPYHAKKSVLILIGPEGDFTLDEINLAQASGFESVNLGNARLRTETAAVVACHITELCNA